MGFHVGQKVVCIKSDAWRSIYGYTTSGIIMPERGSTYTIRDISDFDGELFLWLFEIVNHPREGRIEAHFAARWFRPVIERKTDISIFTEILDKENANSRELELTKGKSP